MSNALLTGFVGSQLAMYVTEDGEWSEAAKVENYKMWMAGWCNSSLALIWKVTESVNCGGAPAITLGIRYQRHSSEPIRNLIPKLAELLSNACA